MFKNLGRILILVFYGSSKFFYIIYSLVFVQSAKQIKRSFIWNYAEIALVRHIFTAFNETMSYTYGIIEQASFDIIESTIILVILF